jgi:unsaturated rhamnogalacturonyl hydrolase
MFVYTVAKGVNRGYLDKRYASLAKAGYDGLIRYCVVQGSDGSLQLDQICEVAGLGFGRDGSYEYYMAEAIVRDDPKGVGPFILAGVEVSKLSQEPVEGGWDQVDSILNRIRPPGFPDTVIPLQNVAKFSEGADVSEAIRKAIDRCHNEGGGTVVIPSGTWLTGPIRLLSNVRLHLETGAVLKFKTDPSAYLPIVYTRWEGVELMNYSPLIYAMEAENIAITGDGILDGQASEENWWTWKGRTAFGWKAGMPEQSTARNRLFEMAENGVPVEQRVFGEGGYLRPSFIQPYRSRNVLIEGITVLRSPMWEIHPVLCENVIIRGVTVISHGPNNDGCNPESCRNVLIEDCTFDTGDDCIAIKSGRNADGRRVAVPSENIVIRGCEMRNGHGGVVIGSEISGGCRNVFVENCRMSSPHLDRAIRIKTNSVRGGIVENLFVRNVWIGEVAESILRVNFEYEEGDASDFTPIVRNVQLQNVTCESARMALFLVGYERSPITGIRVENCTFSGIQSPSILRHVSGLTFHDVEQSALPRTDQWGRLLD